MAERLIATAENEDGKLVELFYRSGPEAGEFVLTTTRMFAADGGEPSQVEAHYAREQDALVAFARCFALEPAERAAA